MSAGNGTVRWVGFVVVLLVLAPTSGCLEAIGGAAQDALRSGGSGASEDDSSPDEGPDGDLSEGQTAHPYEAALATVTPSDEEVLRFSMAIEIEPLEDSEQESSRMKLFVDSQEHVMVLSVTNRSGGLSSSPSTDVDTAVVGAVANTSFLGTSKALLGIYNESRSWDQDWGNLTNLAGSMANNNSGPAPELTDPSSLLEEMKDVPDDAEISSTETTYDGQPALELHVAYANATQEVDSTLVVARDTNRALHLEATVRGSGSGTLTGPGHVTVDFSYDAEATHPYSDELVRLETMTLTGSDDLVLGGYNETRSWTVQPSQNPGLIPLDDVEVHVQDSWKQDLSGGGAQIVLPAEQGRLATPNATVVYDDVDGDGHISSGDEIRLIANSTQAGSWSVALYDEETEMRVLPAPGLLAVVAAVGLVALTIRRRG